MSISHEQPHNPQWWTPVHDSAWDRVKAALRRDWEQTKSDLGPRGSGGDTNQGIGDTFRQATGQVRIPAAGTPNVPNPSDLLHHQIESERSQDNVRVAESKAASAQPGTRRAARLEERAHDARLESDDADTRLERNRALRWENVQEAIRYGYGAGMYHSLDWGDQAEHELRQEWQSMHPGRPWDDVETYVLQGWNNARTKTFEKS